MSSPIQSSAALFQRSWFWISICVGIYILLSYSSFLSWPLLWPDEANFGETAKTLAEEGRLASHLIRGMEEHVYWQPPGYFIAAAVVTRIAGFSIEALRTFSILLGAAILVLTYRLARIVVPDQRAARLGLILLATHPLYVEYMKMARMDALCVVFIVGAIVAYAAGFKRERHTMQFLISGVLIGCAVLTHPMGFVAGAVVSLHLLVFGTAPLSSRIKQLLIVLLPTLVGLGLWSGYIMQDLPGFEQQIAYQFVRKNRPFLDPILAWVVRNRFEPLFLILFLVPFPLVVREAWKKRSREVWLLVMSAACFCLVVAFTFELSYHVYYLPFAAIAGAYALASLREKVRKPFAGMIRLVAPAIVLNGLAVVLFTCYADYYRSTKQNDYYRFTQEVSNHISGTGAVYFFGYPTVYWGLYRTSPDRRYVETVQLRGEADTSILDSVQYVVLSHSSLLGGPADDLNRHHAMLESLCARRRERLAFLGEVGLKERFGYSAEIYGIQRAR